MRTANQPLSTQGRPFTIELTTYLVTITSEKNQPSFCLSASQQTVLCMSLSTHTHTHTSHRHNLGGKEGGKRANDSSIFFVPKNSSFLATELKRGKPKKNWGESGGKGAYDY